MRRVEGGERKDEKEGEEERESRSAPQRILCRFSKREARAERSEPNEQQRPSVGWVGHFVPIGQRSPRFHLHPNFNSWPLHISTFFKFPLPDRSLCHSFSLARAVSCHVRSPVSPYCAVPFADSVVVGLIIDLSSIQRSTCRPRLIHADLRPIQRIYVSRMDGKDPHAETHRDRTA